MLWCLLSFVVLIIICCGAYYHLLWCAYYHLSAYSFLLFEKNQGHTFGSDVSKEFAHHNGFEILARTFFSPPSFFFPRLVLNVWVFDCIMSRM
jgi:hypothetical protein